MHFNGWTMSIGHGKTRYQTTHNAHHTSNLNDVKSLCSKEAKVQALEFDIFTSNRANET